MTELAIIYIFSEMKFLASENALSDTKLLVRIQKIVQLLLNNK